MKEIDQMNLAECLNELHVISRYNRPIADRIHDLTRWIPEDEQYPDEGETVLCWRVETTMAGTKATKPKVGTFRNGRFDCEMDWIRVSKWQRITPPETP